ncbi:DNA polymerase IV [Pseudomonas sp. G11-1]|uniref:DNA polymerase IV n=1 Tax=Halopseudomonas bauzanensis TaxID=653930 RepID=UPI00044F9876|nr:DNA polymerase IV [Halopseudomonas bauzanensis]EZQ18980.1 DNA polymerase IV [Halopseudomonas bauzanensis]MCO5785357.1 DNA polymerase IV [Pseudomonas sp. G11-1]MCO5788539.1 DNA polymerase IV [Pseudomonas sp. G11-2]
MTLRKIIHIDCDCFYAAIEMRDDPRLRNRPLAVGGDPGKRGVIATCNYEARAYGVHSAMASAYAKKLCPDLLIVPGRMQVYKEVSVAIQAIFHEYTPLVQPLSLDEAFLDVTDSSACQGSATLIARQIRQRVQDSQGITVSAGVAPNKFLAKIASDWNKPDGLKVILPEEVDDFVLALPVNQLHGVGKVTAARLHKLGVDTCGELRQWRKQDLARQFGSFGERLWELARGIDNRPVVVERVRQSVSVENTYEHDLPDLQSCLGALPPLLDKLAQRLGRLDGGYRVSKPFIKLKFHDFTQTTLEQAGAPITPQGFADLCSQAFARGGRPVRLIGVGVRLDNAHSPLGEQLLLF